MEKLSFELGTWADPAADIAYITVEPPVDHEKSYEAFNVDLTPAEDGSAYEVGNIWTYVDETYDVAIPQNLAFSLDDPFTVISQQAFAEATSWTFSAGDEDIDPDFTGPSGTGQLCIFVDGYNRCTTD